MRSTNPDPYLLIRIEGSSLKIFEDEVTRAFEDMGKVQRVYRRVTLEIHDLDSLTQVEEVQQVMDSVLTARSWKVTNQKEAVRLETLGRIKIRFMRCPIKKIVMVVSCHRCLGCGHVAKN